MSQALIARTPLRTWILLFALASALVFLLLPGSGSSRGLASVPLLDFVGYWAAGRLNAHGENPYDAQRVEELERAAGREGEGIVMWNPPWALPLVMPLGLLDCRTARWLWLGLHLAVLVGCAAALWRLYGGPATQRGLAWLLAFTFLPALFVLVEGQITPLVLLGAVMFLIWVRQGRDTLAGAVLLLVALKPHLVYLFWPALLLWCIQERRGYLLLGGALAGVAAVGLALLCNPSVLGQYGHALTQQTPQYHTPTLGTLLRLGLGEDRFGLQFWPLILGLAWFVPYWLRHRHHWDWSERLPPLLLASLLTTAFGWLFDLVLLVLPIMQVAVQLHREGSRRSWIAALLVYGAVNLLVLGQLACQVPHFAYLWMTPVLLLLYVALRRSLTGKDRSLTVAAQ
jgi:hypothetical protein